MNTALVSGLIILVLLIIMLIAGVPIAVALGVSSVCAIRIPENGTTAYTCPIITPREAVF